METLSQIVEPEVTGNAIFLLGQALAGLDSERYRIVTIDSVLGQAILEYQESGNRYSIDVKQISGHM